MKKNQEKNNSFRIPYSKWENIVKGNLEFLNDESESKLKSTDSENCKFKGLTDLS